MVLMMEGNDALQLSQKWESNMQKQRSGEKMRWLAGLNAQGKIAVAKTVAAVIIQAVTQNGIVIKLVEDPLTRLVIVIVTIIILEQNAKFGLTEAIVDLLDTGTRAQLKGFITTCTTLANSFTLDTLKAKLKCMPFNA